MCLSDNVENKVLHWSRKLLRGMLMVFAFSPVWSGAMLAAQVVTSGDQQSNGKKVLRLANDQVECLVVVDSSQLVSDQLIARPAWAKRYGGGSSSIETDADFALDVMYTGWQAPGKENNADNPVLLAKKDFILIRSDSKEIEGGAKELTFNFNGKETRLNLQITYRLEPEAFYVRRKVAVIDTAYGHHFLRWFWPRRGLVSGVTSLVKKGDFGQPVALLVKGGGGFFGLEYPTSENRIEPRSGRKFYLQCGQEYGERIGKNGVESEWVVEAVTPNQYVKDWFFKYVDAIRVAPLRPYTLYNSWYDLRSPEYPKVPPENVMSEQSSMKMIDLLRKNMIERHGIKLDAFVLDDGWDVYDSDWILRKEQFPNGLKPLSAELKKTNTDLGVWFGPIGGYSFRRERIGWMKEHGYEVVGNQMCVAGKNYGALLKKRVTDFVRNDGVGYYKWDGIQFSCSEPDHGHPIDIYSRRAVMESVIDLCRSVREKNPKIFLNITSGTWLSPWWVRYANTIWMQGEDYGYADVPSISKRDAAITYRDFVLYDDFKQKDLWFPIANLMTHGIIKGKLEMLGSPDEPLDKLTDDVVLYVARGISMYEFYISPDILSEGEWNSLATATAWAKHRFPILSSATYMIGGNPLKRESYGYAHFRGKRGIIAARNPFITPTTLNVDLAPSQGLDPKASSLVVERSYPTRWISPKVYKAGDRLNISLDAYETAIYEIYPLDEATVPLLAGATFDVVSSYGSEYTISLHSASVGARVLNPSVVTSVSSTGGDVDLKTFSFQSKPSQSIATDYSVKSRQTDKMKFDVRLKLSETSRNGVLAILLTPADSISASKKRSLSAALDGAKASVKSIPQEGRSHWHLIDVKPGRHDVVAEVEKDERIWKGKALVWLIAQQQESTIDMTFVLKNKVQDRPMPPRAWSIGEVRQVVFLGKADVTTTQKGKVR